MKNLGKQVEHLFVIPKNDLESLEIIQEYRLSSDVEVSFYHDNKEGIYPAMNIGALHAKGKYLLYLNSGDEILDVGVFQTNLTDLALHRPSWAILGTSLPWDDKYFAYQGMEKLFRRQSKTGYVSHQSVIVDRKIFIQNGLFDTGFPIAADTKCIFQLTHLAPPLILKDIAVKVEKGFNVTSHNRESRLEVFKLINTSGDILNRLISNANFIAREISFGIRKIKKLFGV